MRRLEDLLQSVRKLYFQVGQKGLRCEARERSSLNACLGAA
jgi:hypothetical protein